jgi:hypothetical protein
MAESKDESAPFLWIGLHGVLAVLQVLLNIARVLCPLWIFYRSVANIVVTIACAVASWWVFSMGVKLVKHAKGRLYRGMHPELFRTMGSLNPTKKQQLA